MQKMRTLITKVQFQVCMFTSVCVRVNVGMWVFMNCDQNTKGVQTEREPVGDVVFHCSLFIPMCQLQMKGIPNCALYTMSSELSLKHRKISQMFTSYKLECNT